MLSLSTDEPIVHRSTLSYKSLHPFTGMLQGLGMMKQAKHAAFWSVLLLQPIASILFVYILPNGDLRNIDILGTVTDGVAYLFGPLLQKRPVNYRSIILLKNLTFIGLSSTRTGLIWSIAAFSRYLRTSLYNNWVCGSEK